VVEFIVVASWYWYKAVAELLSFDAGEVPEVFVAVTVNVYVLFPVNPVTVIGEDAPEAVKLPGEDVTVYETAVPPDVAGVKATDAEFGPGVAIPITGASGRSTTFEVFADASL
jgi:hypothetical protein